MLTDKQMRNRIQWVRDLLSGDFEQGRARLKRTKNVFGSSDSGSRTYEYCCLGVACERIEPGNFALVQENADIGDPLNTMSKMGFLDDSFGLEHLRITYNDQVAFGGLNDDHGWSFARIADFIAYMTANDLTAQNLYDYTYPIQATKYIVPDGFATEWLGQFND